MERAAPRCGRISQVRDAGPCTVRFHLPDSTEGVARGCSRNCYFRSIGSGRRCALRHRVHLVQVPPNPGPIFGQHRIIARFRRVFISCPRPNVAGASGFRIQLWSRYESRFMDCIYDFCSPSAVRVLERA